MEVRETFWKRWLSTPTKPPAKNSNICLWETAYQHKGTRKKCKKTNQAAIIQWQRQCLMAKPHRKPWPKSKTSDISKQSPGPLHQTFLLGRARFNAQPLFAQLTPVATFARSAAPTKSHRSSGNENAVAMALCTCRPCWDYAGIYFWKPWKSNCVRMGRCSVELHHGTVLGLCAIFIRHFHIFL